MVIPCFQTAWRLPKSRSGFSGPLSARGTLQWGRPPRLHGAGRPSHFPAWCFPKPRTAWVDVATLAAPRALDADNGSKEPAAPCAHQSPRNPEVGRVPLPRTMMRSPSVSHSACQSLSLKACTALLDQLTALFSPGSASEMCALHPAPRDVRLSRLASLRSMAPSTPNRLALQLAREALALLPARVSGRPFRLAATTPARCRFQDCWAKSLTLSVEWSILTARARSRLLFVLGSPVHHAHP